MEIHITGIHIELGSAIQEYVQDKLKTCVEKYFDKAVSANVTLSKHHHNFKAQILVNEGTGHKSVIKASCEHSDAHHVIDEAVGKIEAQLKKYHDRLKSHHRSRLDAQKYDIEATSYVLSSDDDSYDPNNDTPVIVAEKPTTIEEMSVSDALMHMEMQGLPAFVFTNKGSGRINVLHVRDDGHISWIDTRNPKDRAQA